MSSIKSAIKTLPVDSAFQIYRYHTPENDSYYMVLSAAVDYINAIPTSIVTGFSINPLRVQTDKIKTILRKSSESLENFISCLSLEEVGYIQSGFPEILFDFELHNNVIEAESPRTNMSFIKIGKRVGTTVSINNTSLLPEARNILQDMTYLERVVVVVPTQERQRELQSLFLDNLILIDHLSKNDRSDVSIDTMCKECALPNYGRVLYTDVTFLLMASSVRELGDIFNSFNTVMNNNGIALYCHTNTTRATYVSFFPGNEQYAERYSPVFENVLERIITQAMGL